MAPTKKTVRRPVTDPLALTAVSELMENLGELIYKKTSGNFDNLSDRLADIMTNTSDDPKQSEYIINLRDDVKEVVDLLDTLATLSTIVQTSPICPHCGENIFSRRAHVHYDED